ncbi:MAG: 50S ribosomal protein L10 [Dehalococcoidales bacterium]|nr:50S ribosomal protein L10 [Dehalococcoidales bacterium]
MSREKKAQIIDKVEESFRKSKVGVLTDYRGLTGTELGSLRRKLKQAGIEFKVVKNTLSRQAMERLGRKQLGDLFKGPMAIAFGYGDESQVPKMLDDYIRSTRSNLKVTGGFMGDTALTAKEVSTLATLPTRGVLISQVMAGAQAPLVGLVSILNAPLRGVVIALQGRMKQLEVN